MLADAGCAAALTRDPSFNPRRAPPIARKRASECLPFPLPPSLHPFAYRVVPYRTVPYLTLPYLPYRTVPHLRRAPLIAPKKGLAGLKFSKKESDYWKEKDPSKNVICKCERVTEAEVTPTLTPT